MVKKAEDITEGYDKDGKYMNPRRDGKTMTKEYVLEKAQYIFSNYVRGIDATSYKSRGIYEEYRRYGAGRQSENKYKPYKVGSDSLNGSGSTFNAAGIDVGGSNSKFDSKEWARKAMGHINWKVMSPMPKIKNKIHASFQGNLYDINIECVDENSINRQLTEKWGSWVDSQGYWISFMKGLRQVAGVPYEEPDKKINTIEELELHEANGGFKLNYAKEGEKVIKDAWAISNQDEIDRKIIDDLVDINIGAYRVYYDREVGKEMVRYVDPAYAGIQYSKHNDYRDSTYAYELTFIPAHKLQSFGVDLENVPMVAQRYAGLFGNPEWDAEYEQQTNMDTDLRCGFFKVPVLDIEWIDVDVDKKVKYTTKLGKEQVRDYEDGEKLSANKQYIETKIPKVYQCKWVVDSDVVYDWGIKPNQPRREKNQSVLSFHFIKGKTSQSLTEQLMPVLDDFQLTWIKFQEAKASAAKAGYAIEWDSLMGMSMGGEKLNPLDMLTVHRVSGNMFYRRNSRHGVSQAKPIEYMPNGMGTAIQDLVLALDTNARLIEEITGINPVSLGATADPNAGKAVTQMSVAASAAPIKNIFDQIFILKGHTSLDLLMRVQLDLKNSPTVRKRYSAVIGEFGVKTLVEAEGKAVMFGTKLVARPTDEDIAEMTRFVDIALQNGRDGLVGIDVTDAMYIKRRLREGGNIKEIEAYISYKIGQKQEQQAQQAAAAAEQNAQQQQALEQLKQQFEQFKAQIEAEKQMLIDDNKIAGDKEIERIKSENKIKEIEAQARVTPRSE